MFFKTLLATLALFFVSGRVVYASEGVVSSISARYEVQKDGTTKANFEVSTENMVTESYAAGFKLALQRVSPEDPVAFDGARALKVTSYEENGGTLLEVMFDDVVVGKGAKRNFEISFLDKTLVDRIGQVWEITLPQIKNIEEYQDFKVELNVPKELGKLAYLSPEPIGKIDEGSKYVFYFSKDSLKDNTVTAAFGEFQVFSFELTYHLENPVNKDFEIGIAIPPDTAFQKVIYEDISPRPVNVEVDGDGNWIAKYNMKSRERFDVKAIGSVQIFSSPREFIQPSSDYLSKNLEETKYWQARDEKILELARKLKTPREIFNFVVSTLNYNYERVKPEVIRLGAKGALAAPNNAMCMEFTDLFVALSRAAGIPAREVNGYAYTENPKLQPLSLVADVLHSWPEYWDTETRDWIAVDPTWTKTTGGEDFFTKLDLRHIVFVIHGEKVDEPFPPGSYKLGSNPQKDVFVSFGRLPQKRESQIEILINKKSNLSPINSNYSVLIENNGPTALYNQIVKVYFDKDLAFDKKFEVVPAYGSQEIGVDVPVGFLAKDMPSQVEVRVGDSSLFVTTYKNRIILIFLIFISLLALFLVFLILKFLSMKS